jgi:hypothetical protein
MNFLQSLKNQFLKSDTLCLLVNVKPYWISIARIADCWCCFHSFATCKKYCPNCKTNFTLILKKILDKL